MVKQDQISELGDYLGEHESLPMEDLALWLLLLLGRRRERFTLRLQAVLWRLLGGKALPKERAGLSQKVDRWTTGGRRRRT